MGDWTAALALRVGRSHYWLGVRGWKPFLSLGRERVLTEPRGFGVYVEWRFK